MQLLKMPDTMKLEGIGNLNELSQIPSPFRRTAASKTALDRYIDILAKNIAGNLALPNEKNNWMGVSIIGLKNLELYELFPYAPGILNLREKSENWIPFANRYADSLWTNRGPLDHLTEAQRQLQPIYLQHRQSEIEKTNTYSSQRKAYNDYKETIEYIKTYDLVFKYKQTQPGVTRSLRLLTKMVFDRVSRTAKYRKIESNFIDIDSWIRYGEIVGDYLANRIGLILKPAIEASKGDKVKIWSARARYMETFTPEFFFKTIPENEITEKIRIATTVDKHAKNNILAWDTREGRYLSILSIIEGKTEGDIRRWVGPDKMGGIPYWSQLMLLHFHSNVGLMGIVYVSRSRQKKKMYHKFLLAATVAVILLPVAISAGNAIASSVGLEAGSAGYVKMASSIKSTMVGAANNYMLGAKGTDLINIAAVSNIVGDIVGAKTGANPETIAKLFAGALENFAGDKIEIKEGEADIGPTDGEAQNMVIEAQSLITAGKYDEARQLLIKAREMAVEDGSHDLLKGIDNMLRDVNWLIAQKSVDTDRDVLKVAPAAVMAIGAGILLFAMAGGR